MDTAQPARQLPRSLTVFGFMAVFLGGFLYFWAQAGGPLPGLGQEQEYRVSFNTTDVKNLQTGGDASIAGVVVGHVERQTVKPDSAHVVLRLSPDAVPLHKGATVRIGVKSIVGQSYVDIVDGDGPAIPDGSTLPGSAVKDAVDVDELLATFDPKTRTALSSTIRSLGTATKGTADDTGALMSGLGKLGREGATALDAIAAQSDDVMALTREATTLLNALDTGRGQIASVVRDARTLTAATAGQRGAIERTMRMAPALLDSARTATSRLGELSESLAPVARDLKRAAPDLNSALLQLPAVTRDLRGLLPALDGTLDTVPATLHRVPTFGSDVRSLVPGAEAMLRDVNPMLAYLEPYGRDVGAMFASFGASMDQKINEGVRPARLVPVYNSASVRGIPLPLLELDPLHWNNPYPEPGQAGDPAPFEGRYPRVEPEPK